MIRVFTKKFWTVLTSCSVVGGIVWACAGGDLSDYGTSNFTPEAFVSKKFSPLFYAPYTYYYRMGYETDQVDRFNSSNVKDWSNYFGDTALSTELGFLLNEHPKATIDSIARFLNKRAPALPPAVRSYSLFKRKDSKITAFIHYLSLAKEAGVFAHSYSGWEYDGGKTVVYEHAALLNQSLLKGFNEADDVFVQQRYWFQLVRSYYFNTAPQKAIDFFEANENKFKKNVLYYRTLSYAAGAYYRLKNYSKANYYYSLVFEGCDELAISAHYSFHPQNENDWNATLALCKNNNEQATLWQMLGVFYGDEKRSMREIFKLSPTSDKLHLLLARAVNKAEQQLSESYESITAQKIGSTSIDQDLLTLTISIANSNNTADPFMWQAAAGYLLTLNHEYEKAGKYLTAAEKVVSGGPSRQWQLRLLKVLHKVAGASTLDVKLENEILADVEWLRTYPADEKTEFRHTDAFVFIRQSLAEKYRRQGDLVKSECYVTQSSFYRENKNVEAMKAFLQKSGPGEYDKLCRNLYNKNLDDLYDYQAIRLAYDNQIDKAIEAMEKAGDKGKSELYGNPFNGKIKDCNDCDYAAFKGTPYSKLALLKKMKEMQTNLQAGTDVFNNALLLGNAFYNLSYYGNARPFYLASIPGSYLYTSHALDSAFSDFLLNMDAAKSYYQKALAAATTAEQKAKCYYLLAKCERNDWYTKNTFNENSYYGSGMVDLKAIGSFKMLNQYQDTKYYQEVLKECGYFREYLKGN